MAGGDFSDDEDGPITFSRSAPAVHSLKPPLTSGSGFSPSQSQYKPAVSRPAPSGPSHSELGLKSTSVSQPQQVVAEAWKGSQVRSDPLKATKDSKAPGPLKTVARESGSRDVVPGKPSAAKSKTKVPSGVTVQQKHDGSALKEEGVVKKEGSGMVSKARQEAKAKQEVDVRKHSQEAKPKQEADAYKLTAASSKGMQKAQPIKPSSPARVPLKQSDMRGAADSDSEDDKPIVPRKQAPPSISEKKLAPPVSEKKRSANVKLSGAAVKKQKASTPSDSSDDSESDSEDEKPIAKVTILKPKLPVKTKVALKDKGKESVSGKRKRVEKKASGSRKGDKSSGNGEIKWKTLEHAGVIFPPEYVPHGISMLYDGKPVSLTAAQEEVATMFAVMKDTDYAQKPKFCQNFWADWKKILGPGHVIKDLNKCDFTPIYQWHIAEKEKKKSMSSEEKKRIKEEKTKAEDKYMWAIVDGVKEKVGNFRVEPPGLFRGRGEHPKMGKLKRRILPEDVVINIGKDAKVPPCPIPGHRWKEVKHDQTVTWLAYWKDPISTSDFKYVFLAPSSSLKGESDREKYEKARRLKDYIDKIRMNYTRDFDSKDALRRQTAVATYLIDRFALRAGNEKGEDEADTVGCCSLKVENVKCIPPVSLEFDFLGKDSIRYYNVVEVKPEVYKSIADFQKGKKPEQNLFDQLDTSKLNKVLQDMMPGLTAKVFRTYNASITLDRLLQTTAGSIVAEKAAEYNKANKEVAILCNHQKSVSKNHSAQIEKLTEKMDTLKSELEELQEDLKRAKLNKPPLKREDGTTKKQLSIESLEKKVKEKQLQVKKKELEMANREDMKTVALGTSKINYMDPRITVAWCKKHEVPIEKMFNKSLLAKFAWAMDVEPDYRF